MEYRPYFSFRDVLWAPARALSAKQITIMTIAVCAAFLVYDLFTYAAHLFEGVPLDLIYSAYGFFPVGFGAFSKFASRLTFYFGLAVSVYCLMLGFFAVSAINIEAVRGHRFFSLTGALRFALKRAGQILMAELAIIAFVAAIVVLFAILGLVTRLPWVGDWLFAILFVIPNFIIALFSVFIIFVITLSVLLLPAVAAAERQGESFGVILETFSTIIRQPLRWGGYTAYALAAAKLASFVFGYFSLRAVQLLTWATSLGGGKRIDDLVVQGLAHLPVRSNVADFLTNLAPGIRWSYEIPAGPLFASDRAVTYVVSVMLFIVFASIVGYALAVVAAGQARGFVAIRYIKDNYKISDEKPLFFTEEHVNPPIEPDASPTTP